MNNNEIMNCYYDNDLMKTAPIGGDTSSTVIIGLNTNEFSTPKSFTHFDFNDIWEIAILPELDSVPRPYLKWQLKDYELKVNKNDPFAGRVIGASFYNTGDTVSLKAIANSGFKLEAWVLGYDTVSHSTEYEFVYNVDTALNFTAHFKEDYKFSGGDGTEKNPYQISNLMELSHLSNVYSIWDKHFILTNDIDASETRYWNIVYGDTLGFSPIGDDSYGDRQQVKFTGSFNGNGNIIAGLYSNRPRESTIGLFGFAYEARINNLGLMHSNTNGFNVCGGLAGEISGNTSLISNCFVQNEVKPEQVWIRGGIVAFNVNASIENCFSTGGVSEAKRFNGGITGYNSGNILNCYSTTNLLGAAEKNGGIVADFKSGNVENCYFDSSYSHVHNDTLATPLKLGDFNSQSTFVNWDFEDIWEISLLSQLDTVPRPYFKWQLYQHNVNFLSDNNGAIEGITTQIVKYGMQTIAVRAIPNDGFSFSGWQDENGDIISYDNPLTIKSVKNDISLTANFTSSLSTANNYNTFVVTSKI